MRMSGRLGACSVSAAVASRSLDGPKAWPVSDGTGVVVAVVDGGVHIDHPDLAANVWRNQGEVCGNGRDDDHNGFVDDCPGWSFADDSPDPRPRPGQPARDHGTHVAGIVAATTGNGLGVAGVAPGAAVMPLRVANANGSISTSSVIAAVRYAVDNGAHVVNLSLVTPPATPRSHVNALGRAMGYARANGVLIVAGVGNDGVDVTGRDTVWPAGFASSYDNVIAVAASTNGDERARSRTTAVRSPSTLPARRSCRRCPAATPSPRARR
jgi:serine protease